MSTPNGLIVYRGPSQLDPDVEIVAIVTGLTGRSANRKTGAMVQTWIMRTDIEPHKAIKSGLDSAVCGDCPFSGGQGCYVITFQAPLAVYRAFKRGVYPEASYVLDIRAAGATRAVRIGSYGDPAAVPTGVWSALTADAKTWTGYTHQWRTADPGLARFCMASVETFRQSLDAMEAGYRTFRVSAEIDPVQGVEITCPASKEAGERTTCADCGLCKGSQSNGRSITIMAHGATAKRARTALVQLSA